MKINIPAAIGCLALAMAFGTAITRSSAVVAETSVSVPAPQLDPAAEGRQVAIFAGGCFWGVQGVYQHVNGVVSATSGYAGGKAQTAKYDLVGRGTTGHAEAVRIVYDPAKVSYGKLMRIFFSVVADPTTLNFQGPDHGPQYRSAIFPTTPEQRQAAAAYIAQLGKAESFPRPIVTRIEAGQFFPAEAYHQNYLVRNPNQPYIRQHDLPKVTALKKFFPAQYRAKPVLVKSAA